MSTESLALSEVEWVETSLVSSNGVYNQIRDSSTSLGMTY